MFEFSNQIFFKDRVPVLSRELSEAYITTTVHISSAPLSIYHVTRSMQLFMEVI